MSEEEEIKRLFLHYGKEPTEKLLKIWVENNTDVWSVVTIDTIGLVLKERGVELPPQHNYISDDHYAPVPEKGPLTHGLYALIAGSIIFVIMKFFLSGEKKAEPESPSLQETVKSELGNKKLKAESEAKNNHKTELKKYTGSYEKKFDGGDTFKAVFFENGFVQRYENGKKKEKVKWKVVGNEIHVEYRRELPGQDADVSIAKIESNGDLTWIALTVGGERTDFPKGLHWTIKKLQEKSGTGQGDD